MRNRLALPQKPGGDPKGREKIQESQRGMRATRLKEERKTGLCKIGNRS